MNVIMLPAIQNNESWRKQVWEWYIVDPQLQQQAEKLSEEIKGIAAQAKSKTLSEAANQGTGRVEPIFNKMSPKDGLEIEEGN